MKQLIASIMVVAAVSPAWAQGAVEKAETRLADLLALRGGRTSLEAPQPVVWRTAPTINTFDLPVRPVAAKPARMAVRSAKEVRPRGMAEGPALVAFQDKTKTPGQPELPTKPLIKLPSVDVHTPLPIPILARPAPDRAALGEPGFEASLDAALKRWTPTRDRPVPFTPMNLPDPFEHRRYGQLREVPEENAVPPVIPIPRPTK